MYEPTQNVWDYSESVAWSYTSTGACPGFLKGGGPVSLGSLKKLIRFQKGGGGGSSTLVSLGRQILHI